MSVKFSSRALKASIVKKAKEIELKESTKPFNFEEYCFPEQAAVFKSPGPRFRTAVTSRRAGKSTGIAADMFDTCMNTPDVTCLYITVTKENARNIIWSAIQLIREDFKIECKLNEVRLTVVFPNRSKIVVGGAKDRSEIEKFRGWKLRKCYIDECQSFRAHILKDLIDDIITPALRDLKGELFLTGTPGPVKAGVFYEYSNSDFWAHFKWTAFNNPAMHNPPERDLEETLAEERIMKGIDTSDPSYIRETYGEWVEDLDSLVFRFSPNINIYKQLPETDLYYIFGIDIGYKDSDAIAVLGFSKTTKKVYLVEELVVSKQDITSLVTSIKALQKHYEPIKMVMDAGALGLKIQEEIRNRHHLNLETAQKHRKVEFIALLNDDLRTSKFQALEKSVFEDDCMLVQWDKASVVRNPENPKISDTYHSDICDAVLYAWRECRHFTNEASSSKPALNTDAYALMLEKQEAHDAKERAENPDYDLFKSFEADIDDYGSSEGW